MTPRCGGGLVGAHRLWCRLLAPRKPKRLTRANRTGPGAPSWDGLVTGVAGRVDSADDDATKSWLARPWDVVGSACSQPSMIPSATVGWFVRGSPRPGDGRSVTVWPGVRVCLRRDPFDPGARRAGPRRGGHERHLVLAHVDLGRSVRGEYPVDVAAGGGIQEIDERGTPRCFGDIRSQLLERPADPQSRRAEAAWLLLSVGMLRNLDQPRSAEQKATHDTPP